MSRDTKKELMWYQPIGDAGAMAEHLEKMAAKGWLLEGADNWWLRYRRGEPVRVRYALTCFPDTTIFDAKPVDGQKTYYNYCRAAGWEYVCSYGALQYFRNPRPDPVPIETDEALRLKVLRRVMLRTMVLGYAAFLVLALMVLANVRQGFRWSPLSCLSGYAFPAAALMGLADLLAALLGLAQVGLWYLRSRWSVKRGGPCARISARMQLARDCFLLAFTLPALALACLEQAGAWLYIVMSVSGYLLLAVAGRALLRWLRGRGLSHTAVLGWTIAGFAAGSIILSFALLKAARVIEDHTPPERVPDVVCMDAAGVTWERYRDSLPLTLEELGFPVTEEDLCSYEHVKSDRTIFAAYDSWSQTAMSRDSELPYLDYQIADIPWDWLRELCWDTIIQGPRYRNRWLGGCTLIDPAPWGASAAARRNGTQALLYGDRIVLIYTSWTPDSRESAIIGEKLGGQ